MYGNVSFSYDKIMHLHISFDFFYQKKCKVAFFCHPNPWRLSFGIGIWSWKFPRYPLLIFVTLYAKTCPFTDINNPCNHSLKNFANLLMNKWWISIEFIDLITKTFYAVYSILSIGQICFHTLYIVYTFSLMLIFLHIIKIC